MAWKGKLWSPRAIIKRSERPKFVPPTAATRKYGVTETVEEDETDKNTIPLYGRSNIITHHSSVMQPTSGKGVTYPSRNYYGSSYGWDNDDDDWWKPNNTPVYEQPKKERKFRYSASEWASYNYYGSLYSNTDDNSKLIVKSPESYLTPTTSQIQAKIAVYGVDKINRIKEMARVCYFKMIDEKDYLDTDYLDGTKNKPMNDKEYNERLMTFEKIMNEFVPGFTPLEQAIHIHYKIEDQLATLKAAKNRGGNALCSIRWTFKREDYSNPMIDSQVELNPLSKQKKLEILNKISIIGYFGKQFSVAKETGERIVPNSDVFKKTMMREYSQFNQIEMYQRMLPNFKMRFLNKELIVNTPVSLSTRKQILIILADYSGSMDDPDKQMWLNAFLIDRFRYVIKGEAEVFFSFFVSSTSELRFQHVKNAEDVVAFWKTMSNYPSGGQTNIGRIVNYVADEVARGRLHNLKVDLSKQKPEILIINDGQDRVGHNSFPYKVNAISLMELSPELKDLCINTGGKQIYITRSNQVTSYSKENSEKVEQILN